MSRNNIKRETYRDRDGNLQQAEKYTVRFLDIRGHERKLAASKNLKVAQDIKRMLETLRENRLARTPIPREIREWLEVIPEGWRKRFVESGLLDSKQAAASKTLLEHLATYETFRLEGSGSDSHDKQEISRVKTMIKACQYKHWSDITGKGVQSKLTELRKARGWKNRTYNEYLTSFRTFLNWAVKEGILAENPITHLSRRNGKEDETQGQRRLPNDEFEAFIHATWNGDQFQGMTGRERALCYFLAYYTGFRWSEIKRLSRKSYDLSGEWGMVRLRKRKNGKTQERPLPPHFTQLLREYFHDVPASAETQTFPHSWQSREHKLVMHDFAAAGIPYKVDGVKFSFHGLRHQGSSTAGDHSDSILDIQACTDHANAATANGICMLTASVKKTY